MKSSVARQTLTSPSAFRTPRAMAAAVWAASLGEDRYWYERDLSVDELGEAVAVINAAVRASRN